MSNRSQRGRPKHVRVLQQYGGPTALEPVQEHADPAEATRRDSLHSYKDASHATTRFPVTSVCDGNLRVGWKEDGEDALGKLLNRPGALAHIYAEIRGVLSHKEPGANLRGFVVMTTHTPDDRRAYEAGLLAFYDTGRDHIVDGAVHAAGDITLDTHRFPLHLVHGALISLGREPPQPPEDMSLLVLHNSGIGGSSTVKYIEVMAQPFFASSAERFASHKAHVVLESAAPKSGQMALPAALDAVLKLLDEHIGVDPHIAVPRSHKLVAGEREIILLKSHVEKVLVSHEDVARCDSFPGAHPLHFFGRVCWTWTGSHYAVLEVVASGAELVELRVVSTSAPTSTSRLVDFGRLCGLPIYTNTCPTDQGMHAFHAVCFRLLGIVQGGNARTVFLAPFDALYKSVQRSLTSTHRNEIGHLTPVLPPVAPEGSVSVRTRARRSASQTRHLVAAHGKGLANRFSRRGRD